MTTRRRKRKVTDSPINDEPITGFNKILPNNLFLKKQKKMKIKKILYQYCESKMSMFKNITEQIKSDRKQKDHDMQLSFSLLEKMKHFSIMKVCFSKRE